MRLLTLREYRTTTCVELSAWERDELRRLAPSITVAPTTGAEGRYDLTPGSEVGALALGSLAVEIRPKLPIDRLLFLLSYALDPRRWRATPFDFAERDSLLEAVVPGFVALLRQALRRGVLQGYRVEEEALGTIRGRLRFDDQLRERFGRLPPAEVRYDGFTEDIEENRLLKAAIARLSRLRLRSQASRQALRAFDHALADVRLLEYDRRRVPAIAWRRLNARYRPAVELARLILAWTTFDLGHGGVQSRAFLVDMNRVFEDFVVIALREELRLSERAFPQGIRGRLWLDLERRIALAPDLSWWDGPRPRFVGDAKYKRIRDDGGIPNADLYQLLAYTIAANLPGGLLIYAAGERQPGAHTIVHAGKRLEVVTLDLSGEPGAILAQIAAVATRIRTLRAAARRIEAPPLSTSAAVLSDDSAVPRQGRAQVPGAPRRS